MSLKSTYFGLQIVRGKYVRDDDIKALPFYEFWSDSARGIGCIGDPETDEVLIPLRDWEKFCARFIKTGRHRGMTA